MDSATFSDIRRQATDQLRLSYAAPFSPQGAQALLDSLSEASSAPYLAAVIIFLPQFATQTELSLALSAETPQGALLSVARGCVQRLLAHAATTTASRSPPSFEQGSTSASPQQPQQPREAGESTHVTSPFKAPSLPVVYDNGGSLSVALAFESEGDETHCDEEEEWTVGFNTDARPLGTSTLDNLLPKTKDKHSFAKLAPLGRQSAKILNAYISDISGAEFKFKTCPDVRMGDHEALLKRLPVPVVQNQKFSVQGIASTSFVHPAPPLAPPQGYEIPKAAAAQAADLAKLQTARRQELVKLLLPSAEAARRVADLLHSFSDPQTSPTALFQSFAPSEEDEDWAALDEKSKFAHVVCKAFASIGTLASIASDRACLAAHAAMVHDYDLQLQRVAAVSSQEKSLKSEAIGRHVAGTFDAGSAVPQERLRQAGVGAASSIKHLQAEVFKLSSQFAKLAAGKSKQGNKKKAPNLTWKKKDEEAPQPGKKTASALAQTAEGADLPAPKKAKASKAKGGGPPANGSQ